MRWLFVVMAALFLSVPLPAAAGPGGAGPGPAESAPAGSGPTDCSHGHGHGFGHGYRHGPGRDQDLARHALEAGEILPLRDILARAESAYSGRMIEARLEGGDGERMIYELRLLTDNGRLMKLRYDARNGVLLAVCSREGGR